MNMNWAAFLGLYNKKAALGSRQNYDDALGAAAARSPSISEKSSCLMAINEYTSARHRTLEKIHTPAHRVKVRTDAASECKEDGAERHVAPAERIARAEHLRRHSGGLYIIQIVSTYSTCEEMAHGSGQRCAQEAHLCGNVTNTGSGEIVPSNGLFTREKHGGDRK